MLRTILIAIAFALNISWAAAADPAPAKDVLEQRRQTELRGKTEGAESSAVQQATAAAERLDDPSEQVRMDAVATLRVLARRVDRSGGQRLQRGQARDAKVPDLAPQLMKAADDRAETVRILALYALADTLDAQGVQFLRDKLKDPSERVRLIAACLLTEFHDASGIGELKKAVKRFQTAKDSAARHRDGEIVLASLQRITGKSFGAIPLNPLLHSNERNGTEAEERFQALFDAWVAWWDWTPPMS